MSNPFRPRTAVLAVAFLAASAPVRAQIVAPPLEHRAIELGYAYKWFERNVGDPSDGIKWEAGSVYGRFGAFDRLTIVAEGGLWEVDDGSQTARYSRWVIGGGAAARVYRFRGWTLDAHAGYNEIYDHDESSLRTDQRTYGWNVDLLVGRRFDFRGQSIDAYAGPAYVNDVAETYPFSSNDPVRAEPDRHWGICAGVYAVFFRHVSGFTYVLYVDEPQLRLGVSLRSPGGGS